MGSIKGVKFELGLVQDLDKEISNLKSLQNPIFQNIDKLTNLDKSLKDEKKLANDNLNKLNSNYEKAVSIYDKLDKSSKELGAEIPSLKTSLSFLKGIESDFNDLKSLLNTIK
jgi:hypothetical protein